jgi:hypothetical protein
MLLNISIAALLMVVTTGIHAGGMMLAMKLAQLEGENLMSRLQRYRILRVSCIVVLMFLASVLEVLVWALTYLGLNALEGLEQALYFSMVTFTTLGYGDISLNEGWRLLSSFEAANGIIIFGWTTAIVMAVVHRVYFGEKPLSPHDEDSGSKPKRGFQAD